MALGMMGWFAKGISLGRLPFSDTAMAELVVPKSIPAETTDMSKNSDFEVKTEVFYHPSTISSTVYFISSCRIGSVLIKLKALS